MVLKIEHLARILDKYWESLDIKYYDDIMIQGHKFLSTDLVMKDHLRSLAASRIDEVDVFYNVQLYNCLTAEFPAEFRKPFGALNFMDMDRHLEKLKKANAQSGRKRFVKIIGDSYGIDHTTGSRTKIVSHNEELDYDKWNTLKRNFNKNQVFQYRNSEVAIIIFVNLEMIEGAKYIQKFMRNTDLISIMVSNKNSYARDIAPDFVPTEDVFSVTDPSMLLEEYVKQNARLIIIGENIDDTYKKAVIRVRDYDRFVRMIVVPELDHKNLDHFIRQVSLVYKSDKWDF